MLSKLKSYFNFFEKNAPRFIDITKYGHEQYQDIIINNKVVKRASDSHPESELRYKIIQKVLNRYQRPFTMLDIGASQGYYSFRTAHDYNCVCVMIEGDNPEYPKVGRQLLDLCRANTSLENVILLNKKIVPEDLKRLAECESFDVVLAFNIIHWFGDCWKEVADAILAMGDNIIIEHPPQEDIVSRDLNALRVAIDEYLVFRGSKVIEEVPRHTSKKTSKIYLLETEKKKLERKQWLTPPENHDYLTIASNYEAKTITKKLSDISSVQINKWVPGINLMTFLMYNGTHPARVQLKQAIKNIADNKTHNDWTANNMILQGNQISLVDWGDPSHGLNGGRRITPKVLRAHLRLVSLKDPAKIERYFWNRLIKNKSWIHS